MDPLAILKLIFDVPPERMASVITLGVIALAMMALFVIHSISKGRDK